MVLRSSARKVARGKGRRKKKVKKTLFEDAASSTWTLTVGSCCRIDGALLYIPVTKAESHAAHEP